MSKIVLCENLIDGELFLNENDLFVITNVEGDIENNGTFYKFEGKIIFREGKKFKDGIIQYFEYLKRYCKCDINMMIKFLKSKMEDVNNEIEFYKKIEKMLEK